LQNGGDVNEQTVESNHQKVIARTVMALALLGCSYLMLFLMAVLSSWYFAPYSDLPPQLMPPPGAWQRTINDLFSGPLGSWTLPIVVVGTSMILLWRAFKNCGNDPDARFRLAVKFGLLNVVGSSAILLGLPVMGSLPIELAPAPGFGFTLKFIVWDLLIIIALLVLQARWGSTRRR
jgi:hypothetical protein